MNPEKTLVWSLWLAAESVQLAVIVRAEDSDSDCLGVCELSVTSDFL